MFVNKRKTARCTLIVHLLRLKICINLIFYL